MTSDQEWSASFAKASTGAMSFYDEIMVPRLFEPWAQLLLDTVNPENGQDVLDVACGPGTVTRLAAQRVGRSGRVTGCDLSPAMLDLARAKAPMDASAPIDYVECPADALLAPDHAFDVVTCQQGLQFFPNRKLALVEMRRVLRPGGSLGVSVWCAIEDCPPFHALAIALDEVLGTEIADIYKEGPWGFGDSAALARLAIDSGFTNVEVRRYELPVVFEGGPGQLLLTLHAAAVAKTLEQLSDADEWALEAAVEKASRSITVKGAIRSYAASHILTANAIDG
ncbi:MAG: class I SAM-dependent methyltransferase [Acidimicrobiales bacterium]